MRSPTLLPLALILVLACNENPSDGESETGETSPEPTTDEDPNDTGECTPAGVYEDCLQGGVDVCGASGQPTLCVSDNLENPSIGVCARRCDDVCDCWAAPATGDAEVACVPLVDGDPKQTCVLDCSGGQTCPDGMACVDPLQICVWSAGG